MEKLFHIKFKLMLLKTFKTNKFILLSALILIGFSCNNEGTKSGKTGVPAMARIEVSINGMTCTGCEQIIKSNVEKLDGIKSVEAAYKLNKAIVEFDSEIVDTTKIRTAITRSGYKVAAFIYLQLNDSIK
jgi:copper chaperone CopZ